MRILLALGLALVSAGAALASPSDPSPTCRGVVVPWRVQSWRPTVASVSAPALRSDPEAGAPDLGALAEQIAARRAALARVPVRSRADGSRFAVVGGLARGYVVARIGEEGTLSQSCVESEGEARRLVTPAGKER